MKVKLKASHLVLVGKRIDSEGRWTADMRMDTWQLNSEEQTKALWHTLETQRINLERARADRMDVRLEVIVNGENNQIRPSGLDDVLRLLEGIELTDEPTEQNTLRYEPERKLKFYVVCCHAGHVELDQAFGLFDTYAEARAYGANRWKAWRVMSLSEPRIDE